MHVKVVKGRKEFVSVRTFTLTFLYVQHTHLFEIGAGARHITIFMQIMCAS